MTRKREIRKVGENGATLKGLGTLKRKETNATNAAPIIPDITQRAVRLAVKLELLASEFERAVADEFWDLIDEFDRLAREAASIEGFEADDARRTVEALRHWTDTTLDAAQLEIVKAVRGVWGVTHDLALSAHAAEAAGKAEG